ncbi:DEAD/DEAH box helicase [Carpediemonas membranifera]|uniref:RNA helicase n=1 Tax=Carpediemonas membranifera TaxID=201153 RepID=A0A8J6E0D2_9EUKA|nr:DEAD/DEAH box helicase [Carpediemonas membranifera]|eukprot:KAG9392048.1 DEAD/DEAH box helicase [Carpediemonas membranifera]
MADENTAAASMASSQFNSNWEEVIPEFEGMGLKESLLSGIFTHGFSKPSPIQQRGIRPIVLGRDMIAQAQSGTGKTATFTIGVLERLDESLKATQVLILAPTRELALQSEKVVRDIGGSMDLSCHVCIGGTSSQEDMRILQSGVQVVVGTPGRVLDMINRGALRTEAIKSFVLDEADEMLSQGFTEQIYTIFQSVPAEVQVLLLSATMPDDVLQITDKFMRDPVKILVRKDELTLDGIQQFFVPMDDESWKLDVLLDLYKNLIVSKAVIFCNTKRKVEWLSEQLQGLEFAVSCVHSEMDQQARNDIMNEFRRGATRVLIGTDLIARGIDVQQVSLVINYDLPKEKETYLHRIGRSGRFGRKGIALNFVVGPRDEGNLAEISQFYKTEIKPMPEDIASYT